MKENSFLEVGRIITGECTVVLEKIRAEEAEGFLDLIEQAEKVFFVGVGRVFLSMQAMAKRYAHLGISTVVVGQITEPAMTDRDLLVVGSGSGETLFPLMIAKKAKELGATVVQIGYRKTCSMEAYRDFFVKIPVSGKEPEQNDQRVVSKQPMTSLFEQTLLLFGDAIAMLMIQRKNICMKKLWQYHANLE